MPDDPCGETIGRWYEEDGLTSPSSPDNPCVDARSGLKIGVAAR